MSNLEELNVKAFTLFNLKPGKNLDDYEVWSLQQVHPRMLKMPSVLAFRDYRVTGAMGGGEVRYQLVEEIEITTPEEFEQDNAEGDGLALAKEWQGWVGEFTVIYCQDIK
jgi:hypothetical protein